MADEYDLIVVGNGSAGDNIARTLGRRGKRVAVIERQHLGGECLNDGCIPSKALVDIARTASRDGMSWDEVKAHVTGVTNLIRGDSPDGGLPEDGVDLFWGDAEFLAPTTVRVGTRELRARDVVVATGTAPGLPPIPGLAEAAPVTNREVFSLPSLPLRLAVIGAGPIGLELGQAFHRLGSQVTMFEADPRIAPTEDEEISAELARLLSAEGLTIRLSAGIESVHRDGEITITFDGREECFDEVLVAAGRDPQVPASLVDLGLALTPAGYIRINDCGKTNLPGLWAAGDVTGKFLFTHFAAYQAHHIGRHIMEDECHKIPDTLVPWAIFTDPEIGHAGLTEAQARELHGDDLKVGRLEAREFDWFRTTGNLEGFAKVIAVASTGRLIGAHFICARGSTLVGEAALAIQHRMTARDVVSTVHAYPTASELFRWACAKAV